MKKLCVRSSDSPQFKVDNIEYLLHRGSYHVIQMDRDFSVIQSSSHGALISVLQVIKHLPNSRIVCIIGTPTTSRFNQLFKDHLGVRADKSIVDKYWAYIGIKKTGHLEVLRYGFSVDCVELLVSSDEIMTKSEPPQTQIGSRSILITKGAPVIVEPDQYFDHIYLMNLYKEPFKLLKMTYALRDLNLDFTAIQSHDNDLRLTDTEQPLKLVGQKQAIVKILDDAIDRDYDSIVILTDNISLGQKFVEQTSQVLSNANNLDVPWDVIFLANSHIYKDQLVSSHKLHVPSWKAIALSKRGIVALKSHITASNSGSLLDITKQLIADDTINCVSQSFKLVSFDAKAIIPTLPSVEVVVKVGNDADVVGLCLYLLLQQDYKGTIKYMFVNESTDETIDLIKKNMRLQQFIVLDSEPAVIGEGYRISIDTRTLLPYTYISRAILLMNRDYLDCIAPAVVTIDSRFETNITTKLQVKESPLFLSATKSDDNKKYAVCAKGVSTSCYPTTMIELPLYRAL